MLLICEVDVTAQLFTDSPDRVGHHWIQSSACSNSRMVRIEEVIHVRDESVPRASIHAVQVILNGALLEVHHGIIICPDRTVPLPCPTSHLLRNSLVFTTKHIVNTSQMLL